MPWRGRSATRDGPEADPAERMLRAGLDELRVGFGIFDPELRLVACNRAFGELRGYPRRLLRPGTELVALYRFNAAQGDYGPGEIEDLVAPRLARARSGRPCTLSYTLAAGRIVSVSYAPLAGGLLIAYADITERERAAQALRESEERYALAMAGANEGMWDWVAGSDEVIMSESYKRLIGLDLAGDRMSLAAWVALIHPDDLPVRDRARSAHLDGTAASYACEYRVRCGDGVYRWFQDRATSSRDAQGRVVRMAGSLADITARKDAEQALRAAHDGIKAQNKALRELSRRLSKYLPPQVYASIFKGRQIATVSASRKKLTIFFADLTNFSGVAERLEAEELTNFLNRYLTEMAQIALAHGATIDKYIGDAVMAFFGDPTSRGIKADALACVQMALAMQARMRELQPVWRGQGIEWPVQMRVGINTGYCTVGNFGSKDRLDYTAIGSAVNLAWRLQTCAQPGQILLAQETFSLVEDAIAAEEQASVAAKGIASPVRSYRVVGKLDELAREGRIIREQDQGVRIYLDLYRGDRARVVALLERVIERVRGAGAGPDPA